MNPGRHPLTTEQQALAADPRHIRLASAIAARYARAYPRHGDEFHSEALLALCQAACTFVAGRRAAFSTHAVYRIKGAMLDVLRGLAPTGYRRRDPGTAPRVGSLADVHPAAADPVGWELAYHDELKRLTRALPAGHRTVLRLLYGHGECARMKDAARAVGLSESRVSYIHGQAVRMLAEDATRAGEQRRTGS